MKTKTAEEVKAYQEEKITLEITLKREEWEIITEALNHFCVYSNGKAEAWEKKEGLTLTEALKAPNGWRRAWEMSGKCWLTLYKKLQAKK